MTSRGVGRIGVIAGSVNASRYISEIHGSEIQRCTRDLFHDKKSSRCIQDEIVQCNVTVSSRTV